MKNKDECTNRKMHEYSRLPVCFFESTDSTNAQARRYAEGHTDMDSPVLFIAQAQTHGRGRLGRSFYSPPRSGLYMTLLMRLPDDNELVTRLTPICAVAAAEAIRTMLGFELKIKWVNDLYFEHKKVAGILAESFSAQGVRYVALGIGINVTTDSFPEDIQNKAGALLRGEVKDREMLCSLAQLICANIISAMEHEDVRTEYMREYKKRSCVIRRKIIFEECGRQMCGIALDITDSGTLVVECEDGKHELMCGEVSVYTEDGGCW